MASKIEPGLNQEGNPINWDPERIPAAKPFVKLTTSAYEPVTTFDNMRFVKTKSLIYTPFHKEARYVNFEIGYSKEAKWLEFLNDKWLDYANFFVGGFFEGIYTVSEKGVTTTLVQIEAKIIDCDTRFRHPSSSKHSVSSPTSSPSTNIFAQRRNKVPPISSTITRNDSVVMEDIEGESSNNDINEEDTTETEITTPTRTTKRKLSDFCNIDDEPVDEAVDDEKKGRGGRGERGGRAKKI